jgi:hypothetical protein
MDSREAFDEDETPLQQEDYDFFDEVTALDDSDDDFDDYVDDYFDEQPEFFQ